MQARITCPTRTILDVFRFHRRVGMEVAKEALYEALGDKRVTTDELYRMLDLLPSTKLRATLEAML